MHAPIDIVISIVRRHLREALEHRNSEEQYNPAWHHYDGRASALSDLIDEFEAFKKIFN